MPIASNSVASFTRMGFNEQIQALSFFPTSLSVLLFLFFSHDGFVFLLIVVSQKLLKMIYSSHLTLSKYLIENYSCGRFPGR